MKKADGNDASLRTDNITGRDFEYPKASPAWVRRRDATNKSHSRPSPRDESAQGDEVQWFAGVR